MNAIIIDDEPLALRSMERLLGNAGINVVGSFSNPLKAIEQGLQALPDLAFLDIEMPEMNGLETAERLLSIQPNLQIVFVTAYHDYAIEAFELNALDYLMKPVQPARLNKTLQRIDLPGKKAQPKVEQEQQITLRFFKYLHIHHPDKGALPIHWRTTKAQELFAYLVHHRHRAAIRKDELIDLLWADHDLQKASALLHTTVYQVRRTLKQIDPSLQIQFIDGGFRLLLGGVKLDVEEWERSLELIPPLSAETLDQHEQLLALYTGNYLEDHHYLWAEKESERLRLVWLDHIKPTIAYYIEHENYAKALHGLQLVQETLPYSQDGYLGLMQLNARLGHYEEVKKLFKQYTLLLHEDLGIEPEERISSWYMQWLH
ncbi:response regulator [Paenibacillus sp. GCM10027626]|uniref:response regulator n=1 Tax=Paenibacillus sp. GCM10027626 TaxID=3273411 RepID=UPI0036276671